MFSILRFTDIKNTLRVVYPTNRIEIFYKRSIIIVRRYREMLVSIK